MGHVFGLMLIVWMLVGAQGRHVKDGNTDTKVDPLIRVLQDVKEGTLNVTSDQTSTTTAPTTTTTTTTTSARKQNPYEVYQKQIRKKTQK